MVVPPSPLEVDTTQLSVEGLGHPFVEARLHAKLVVLQVLADQAEVLAADVQALPIHVVRLDIRDCVEQILDVPLGVRPGLYGREDWREDNTHVETDLLRLPEHVKAGLRRRYPRLDQPAGGPVHRGNPDPQAYLLRGLRAEG